MSRKCLRPIGPRPARHSRRKAEPKVVSTTELLCLSIPAARHIIGRVRMRGLAGQLGIAGCTRTSWAKHNVTPFTGRLSGKSITEGGDVSGPQAGNSGNRRPDTHSRDLQGSPSSSPETCARARYVSGWIVSVYLSRAPYDTQHLSSCLVTRASNVHGFPGRRSGRGL
jgi:hypothetical protein